MSDETTSIFQIDIGNKPIFKFCTEGQEDYYSLSSYNGTEGRLTKEEVIAVLTADGFESETRWL